MARQQSIWNAFTRRPARIAALAVSVSFLGSVSLGDTLELKSPNEEAQGFFGSDVDGIPDVDGDGFDDIVVGASGESGGGVDDSGRAYIFSGATGLLIRAHSSPTDTVDGAYGAEVAGVPDINGDGRGDYIIGAPLENGPGGRVYVYSGASGALIRTHISPNAEAGGRFGHALDGIRDLNNDGRGDYVIGAYAENNGGTIDAGRVYVYSGINGTLIRTHMSPNAESNGNFGFSVSGVPDANNDGRGDYIVGAPNEDPGASPSDSGRAYLYNGINGAVSFTFSSPNAESGGHYGYAVAGIPDVGGNGFGDVIIGAPQEDVDNPFEFDDWQDAGRAYLYSGTSGGLAHTFVSPEVEVEAGDFDNGAATDSFGAAVDGLNDIGGDGLGDVIIGAPGHGAGGGEAYVFFADAELLWSTLDSLDDLGINQSFGASVAGIGDLNGDGLGDYVVGGLGSDNFPRDPSQGGRAYVYRQLGNDGCSIFSSSLPLYAGDNFFSTIGALEGGAEDDCPQFAEPGPDAWFYHEAQCTGSMTVSTCGQANYNTKIAVYQGCGYSGLFSCNLSTLLGCNDNSFFCLGGTSVLTVDVVAGQCYRIRIGGANNEYGSGTVTISYNCDCVGDINNDGSVDGADLGLLLSQWGADGSGDLNNDNTVDGADLGLLLSSWGPC